MTTSAPLLDLAVHYVTTGWRTCANVFAMFPQLGSVLVTVDRWRARHPVAAT